MSTLSLTPSTRLLSLAYCMYSLKPSVTGAKATAGVPDSGWYEPTLSSPSIGALAASGSAQSSVLAFHASAGASLADGAVTSAVLSGASVSDGGVVSATLDAVVTAPPPVVVADDSLLSSLPHAASSRTPTAVRAARCLPLRIIGFSPLWVQLSATGAGICSSRSSVGAGVARRNGRGATIATLRACCLMNPTSPNGAMKTNAMTRAPRRKEATPGSPRGPGSQSHFGALTLRKSSTK